MASEAINKIDIAPEEYEKGGYWTQINYIEGIFNETGVLVSQKEAGNMHGSFEAKLLIGFSRLTEIKPQDNLFKLAQALACSRALSNNRPGRKAGYYGRKKNPELQEKVDIVKKRIAEKIFAEESDFYLAELGRTLFMHLDNKTPNTLSDKEYRLRKERNAKLLDLTKVILEKFPVTSR